MLQSWTSPEPPGQSSAGRSAASGKGGGAAGGGAAVGAQKGSGSKGVSSSRGARGSFGEKSFSEWIVSSFGGDKGGELVAAGTPEEIAACERSQTGRFLREVLKPGRRAPGGPTQSYERRPRRRDSFA